MLRGGDVGIYPANVLGPTATLAQELATVQAVLVQDVTRATDAHIVCKVK